MANVSDKVTQIRQAIYGKDVRESIASGIETINEQVEVLDATFEQLIINAGESNAEIVAARVKADATAYPTLGDRLNAADAVFEEYQTEINNARGGFDTLRKKLDSYAVNVKDFGAKGDGITDDTAAMQAALNDVESSGGGIVFVPDGNYALASALQIPSNTCLRLSQKAKIIRKSNTDNMIRNKTAGATGYDGNSNIIISGGIWDANMAEYPSACTVIAFGHAKNITIKDVTIINLYNWHMIELNAVKNGKILNCHFENYGTDTVGTEMIQLDSMSAVSVFPWFGQYDNTPCEDIVIEGCTFSNGVRAIGSHTAIRDVTHKNIRIINCSFDNMKKDTIRALNYEGLMIASNQFLNCYQGIYIRTENMTRELYHFIINDNYFKDMTMAGAEPRAIFINAGGGYPPIKNGVISGNIIDNVVRHAIGIDFCQEWVISNNIIKKSGQVGIFIYRSSDVIVTGNQLVENTGRDSNEATGADLILNVKGGNASQACILQHNKCKKIYIGNANTSIISNNIVAETIETSTEATNCEVYNNFINAVWTQ